ncbi:hypothetical protein MFLO_01825 [Listeria floridensis FSL S10-1187]|uniref:DUF4003 domain-containing protein n=1 Tax=Listeria floridensis FSL S10-1187 TaxID=1265817 RepID=A0ABN0RJA8_9LIST|nr:DUF4003 family protein [Listeria floridensis]EUJ33919.1 hypothetical protein MFLO_01825 [Listeria floridensis FSL S10-1187]
MTQQNGDARRMVTRLKENYEKLRKSPVKYTDKRIRYLVARLFAGQDEQLDIQRFSKVNQLIKERAGTFTVLTTNVRAALAGLLLKENRENLADVEQLFANYQALIEGKFPRTEYTYFAAQALMSLDSDQVAETIVRAKKVHEAIKQHHPFLTGNEDISMSVLLAMLDEEYEPSELADLTEFYFTSFDEIGFKKNNGLQFLAGISVLLCRKKDPMYVKRVRTVLKQLEKQNIKPQELFYSTIGVLAFVLNGSNFDQQFDQLYAEVKMLSGLRFDKNFQTALALSLYVEQKTSELSMEQTEQLMVSLTALIAIEQAVIVSAVVVTAAIVNTSSSNS